MPLQRITFIALLFALLLSLISPSPLFRAPPDGPAESPAAPHSDPDAEPSAVPDPSAK